MARACEPEQGDIGIVLADDKAGLRRRQQQRPGQIDERNQPQQAVEEPRDMHGPPMEQFLDGAEWTGGAAEDPAEEEGGQQRDGEEEERRPVQGEGRIKEGGGDILERGRRADAAMADEPEQQQRRQDQADLDAPGTPAVDRQAAQDEEDEQQQAPDPARPGFGQRILGDRRMVA